MVFWCIFPGFSRVFPRCFSHVAMVFCLISQAESPLTPSTSCLRRTSRKPRMRLKRRWPPWWGPERNRAIELRCYGRTGEEKHVNISHYKSIDYRTMIHDVIHIYIYLYMYMYMNETRLRTLLGTQHISLLSQHLHKTSQNGFWVAKVLKLKEQNKAMRIGQAVPDRGEMAKNGDSECGEWLWYPRKCWQEMLVDSGISSVLFVALKETSTGKSNHLILCPPGLFGVPKLFSCFLHTFPWVFNNFSQTNEISCYPCFVGAENCQGVNHGSLSERILFQYGDSRGTQCLASIEWPWGSCRIFVWHVRTHPFHHFIPFPPK